jgi:hypothetical protein
MAIHSDWDNESKTIIRREMSGTWSWDEYIENNRHEHEMAISVPHDVRLIIDTRQSLTLPIGALIQFKRALESNSKAIKLNLVVGANPMLRTVHQILMQLFPHFVGRVILVKTFDEAYDLIEQDKQETLHIS